MNLVKVLVIGLDAAEPSLIEKWRDELPNISRIMKGGVYGRMRSSDPPQSIPAWNCLCTGKNPGKIGTYDFFYREKGGYQIKVVNSTVVRTSTLWKVLGDKGRKVAVIGVPSTFPPEPVNGIMVSGLPLPVTEGKPLVNYAYPPDLFQKIEKLVGGYEYALNFNVPTNFAVSDLSWATSTLAHDKTNLGLSRAEEKQLQIAKQFLQNTEWEYFMVVFRELDRIGHFMWKYIEKPDLNTPLELRDAIKQVYLRMDQIVGELLQLIDSDTVVFIVSDHGFGPLSRRFFVNEFLQRIGMLKLKPAKRLQVGLAKGLKFDAQAIMQLLLRMRLHWLVGLVPKRVRRMVRAVDQFEANVDRTDWARTRAYAFGEVGRIFINLKGRESHGIVEAGEEYDKVRDLIIEKLKELTDPATGAKMIERIFKREEVFWGEFAEEGPDILFYMDGLKCITSTRIGNRSLFEDEVLTNGTHRPYGIIMAYGNGIRKGVMVNAHIYDVAPTILHLMGLPVPDDMDGKPLLDLFEPESEAYRRDVSYEKATKPQARAFEWSAEEEKKVEEQLRDLGYLG